MEFIIGTLLAIIGIVITVIIFRYQERSPDVKVECYLLPDGNPSVISCTVSNTGRAEARDVYVGFNRMLPLDTRVMAAPEIGAEIIEADSPPDPQVAPKAALLLRAFAVRIPRVAAKSSVTFQIRTIDPDNQRAAEQRLRIQQIVIEILKAFSQRLITTHPESAKDWNLETLLSVQRKEDNFFTPGHFSYEKGRFSIAFITEDEKLAQAVNQDMYARYKAEFIDIYQDRPKFKAPVLRIRAADGETTVAIFPAYIGTFLDMLVSKDEFTTKGAVTIRPPVPRSYD